MGSDNLEVESFVAIHAPYADMYPASYSLEQIAESMRENTIQLVKHMLRHGYTLELLDDIINNTKPEVFMVFVNAEDLHQYRNKPFTFVEQSDILYDIMNKREIRREFKFNPDKSIGR